MKRYLSFILLILTIFMFVACTNDTPAEDTNKNDDINEIQKVYHNVVFAANEGGYISGSEVQSVEDGASSKVVKAIASFGYEFVSWSDGVKDEKREIKNVTIMQ